MIDTEFDALPENEKHFMRIMNGKTFLFILEFRQKGPSPDDCLTWGLSAERMDFLAQEVARHQTRAAGPLAGLERPSGSVEVLASTIKRALHARLSRAQAQMDKAAKEIKDTLSMLEKMP